MFIRPLTRADIPRVLDISVQCFSSDELFRWLYPYQDKYPRDLGRYQLIRLRTRLVEQGSRGYVAVTELGDEVYDDKIGPLIVGFSFSIREGNDLEAVKWRSESWFNKLERFLLSWDKWYEQTFLARANDPKAEAIFAAASEYKFYKVLKDYWLLGLLGSIQLLPTERIGQQLVKHGLEIAEGEGMPVLLEASVVGRKMYQTLGFKTIQLEVIAENVEGLEPGCAMLWEPPELKGCG